jgi:hypothetical protein
MIGRTGPGGLLRSFRPRRGGRLPLVLLVAACAVAVTAAVSDADVAPPGVRFAQIGHWIANPSQDIVFHVNGSSRTVDAQAPIEGIDEGSLVIEGETSAYVISREKVMQFGKSSLAVEQTMIPPTGEQPFQVQARGGPYVVYREAGTVVRLGGDDPATITVGPGLGDPVATPDGTLWLHRKDTNQLCQLASDADRVSCPADVPGGHAGALTVVGKQAVFVDTESDTLTPVTGDGLGRPTKIGNDLPADAKIAAADVDGRVAVVDQRARTLYLVDGSGLGQGRAAPPVEVTIPDGEYATPAAGRSSVVLLDLRGNKVRTYDRQGRPQRETDVPKEAGEARLARGEDQRVYVDGGEGKHVLVVGEDGSAGAVPLIGAGTPGRPRQPVAPPPEQPFTPATDRAQPGPGRQTGSGDDDQATPRRNPQPRRTDPVAPRTQAPKTQAPRVDPPRTNPPRTAAPPSRPGMPPRLRASASGTSVKISWGAAAANGATVTGYRVTWTPSGGGKAGSSSRAGSSRSMTASGLERGKTYRITVAAQNAAGRGSAATRNVTVPRAARSLTVSRGSSTTHGDCEPPKCAWIRVVMRGFAPNTSYKIDVFSSDWGNFNPGARLSTDASGTLIVSDRFAFGGVGQRVWVTAGGLESNHYLWPSG